VNWNIAAGAGAAITVITFLVITWKGFTVIARIARLHPVIMEVAEQFKTDTGSSLKDQINRLEQMAKAGIEVAANAAKASETMRTAAEHQSIAIEALRTEIVRSSAVSDRLGRLEERIGKAEQ
jgi:hypothetical protein